MRRFYYAVKRLVRPLLCLFGKHDYKMSVTDKTGRSFACLWCRKSLPVLAYIRLHIEHEQKEEL